MDNNEKKYSNEDLEKFAKWFNHNQWVGGKGDYLKGLFVKQDFKSIVKEYLKTIKDE